MIDWQKLLSDPLTWNEDPDRRKPVKFELGPANGKSILDVLLGK